MLIQPIARSPLLGREAELEWLRSIADTIERGEGGRVVFLAGDPGVGKTRLAHELAAYARTRSAIVAEGRYFAEDNIPYGPWVQALRTALHHVELDRARELLDPLRADLVQLMPEIGAGGPQRSPAVQPLAPDEQRRRLYEAVGQLVQSLSQGRPLVLMLDDVQWAPGLTLLAHIARSLPRSRALLVCCYRQDEFEQQPRLMRIWAELNRSRLSSTLNLKPLTRVQTVELLEHHVGAEVAARLGDAVHRRAAGNPFFTEDVLQTLIDTGVVQSTATGWQVSADAYVAVPESMKLAVEARVARHAPVLPEVLNVAAVLGQEFSFDVLQRATGLPEDELVGAIEGAIASRLLVDRSASGEERYAFADDQIQEVLYAAIPAPRRRRLHLRSGSVLEERLATRPNPPLEQLARHFLEAGYAEKGAEYAARAGRKSAHVFNWEYAVRFYDQALQALVHLPDSVENRRKRVDVLLDRVSVSFGVDPAESLARLEEALSGLSSREQSDGPDAASPEDRARLGQVLYWLGRLHVFQNDMHKARTYLERSIAVIEPTGNAALLAIPSSAMGRLSHAQGRFSESVRLLRGVLEPLERAANWPEWIASQGYLGAAVAAQGAYAEGLAAAEQALSRAQTLQSPTGMTLGYVCLACVHLHGNDMPRMLAASREAVQAAHRSGDRLFLYQGLVLEAWAESRLGDHVAAARTLQRAYEMLSALGGRALFSDWHAAMHAEMELNLGNPEAARERAAYAVEVARRMQGLFSEGIAERVLARTQGPEESAAHLRASVQAFETGGAVAELERTQPRTQVGTGADAAAYPDGLTAREVEVLRLLAAGRTNREIAAELIISPTTVDRHISNIYAKITAHGRAEAATYALAHGLLASR